MISVLIPLGVGSVKDNWELRHTLRSIEENFDFDYTITLYSQEPIDWLQNVNIRIVPRVYPEHLINRWDGGKKHYENYYDTLNKLILASNDESLSEDILYVYDDVLLLKKQDLSQIKKLYAGGMVKDNPNYWSKPRGNKWMNTILQAIERAKEYGEVYLYETHLPRTYNKTKLREMFKKYPIKSLDIPYAPATLYFNMFYDKPDEVYKKNKGDLNNSVKAGFYGTPNTACDLFLSKRMDQVLQAVNDKIWVNYNDNGLQPPLVEWIEKRFPNKSRYER